jgi:hypothetical protein
MGQLAPSVSKDVWLPEEDSTLIRIHSICGNHWTTIATQLPARSALCVKNRWSWLVRRRATTEERLPPSRVQTVKVVEQRKPAQIIFGPLELDERIFGSPFHEFRVKMLMGDITQ